MSSATALSNSDATLFAVLVKSIELKNVEVSSRLNSRGGISLGMRKFVRVRTSMSYGYLV